MRPADIVGRMVRPADVMRARRDQALARQQPTEQRRKAKGRPAGPVEPVELTERRDRCTKIYRIGSQLHLCQSVTPVHYLTSTGAWEEIDTTFRSVRGTPGTLAVMDRASYRAVVLDHAVGWRHESADGGWMQMELLEVDGHAVGDVPPGQVVDGQVHWDQVAPGVDLWLVAYPHRSEMFKRYHGPGPHELVWQVTHSPNFSGRLQEKLSGWDQQGNRLEIETSRDGGRFVERWTGRISTVVDRKTRRREWRQAGPDSGPVVVDAAISEPISANIDDGYSLYGSYFYAPYWSYGKPFIAIDYDFYGGSTIDVAGGWRFPDLQIPTEAQVDDATLTLNLIGAYGGNPTVRIYADNVDNAPQFSDTNVPNQINRTSAYTVWEPTGSGPVELDVRGLVAEVVSRPGWAPGNAIRLGGFQRPAGYSWVEIYDYTASPGLAAQLDITFTLPDVPRGVIVGGSATVRHVRPPRDGAPAQPLPAQPQLDLMPWIGQRSATFRFDLIDGPTGIHKGTLNPVRDTVPTLVHDTGRTITRSVTIDLDRTSTEKVNTVRDRVQITMLLDKEEFPLGTYTFVNNPRSVIDSQGGRESAPALMDPMWRIDQQLSTGFAVHESTIRGRRVLETAQAALARFLTQFDLENVVIEPSTFASPGAWAAGATGGQVVEDLALMGDWFSPWFDHHGRLRFVRSFDPGSRLPEFDFDTYPVVIRDSIAEVDDLLEAPNQWVVISSGTGDEQSMTRPVVGTYDLPDEAPHSAANREIVIPEVIDLQVSTVQQATAVARNLGQRQTLYEQVELSTPPDPRHDSYNIVRWDGRLWLEIAWSMQLVAGGTMRHTLRRAYSGGDN